MIMFSAMLQTQPDSRATGSCQGTEFSDSTLDSEQSHSHVEASNEASKLVAGAPDSQSHILDFLLIPRISKGHYSLPCQSESRKWLKYLILVPASSIVSLAFFAYFWVPMFIKNGLDMFIDGLIWDNISQSKFAMAVVFLPVVTGFVFDISTEVWACAMLLRGKQRRYLPETMPRLVHAVIVCNYKEPLEVLRATVASLADNTLASSTIVLLACEDRDPGAEATFAALEVEFSQSFRSFFKTTHKLAPREVAGKSSNENFACKELYKIVKKENLDPFRVMVTTCDADSLFDKVFLEQLEAEYCRMPDGRRFLYNSPINTYRNLPECNIFVKAFEILRCQYDTFNGLSFRPAQSNYSLTLGFAKEINFWDPSNTSEDFHTTLKAMATTGKGTSVVVRVWSLILNDSVCNFGDRWVQAKRHMWGIEEIAFVGSLFPVLRINLWLELFGRVTSQMFGVCLPWFTLLLFGPVREALLQLRWETRCILVIVFAGSWAYSWIKALFRELFLYKYIIGDRNLMMERSMCEWLQLFVLWPILGETSCVIFATLATWRMLIHAVFHETLVYVTAPKALSVSATSTIPTTIHTTKPKKSI